MFRFKSLRPEKNRVPIVVLVATECWREVPETHTCGASVTPSSNSRPSSARARKPRKIEGDLTSLEPLPACM